MLIHILPTDACLRLAVLAAQCCKDAPNSRRGLLGACKYIQRQSGTLPLVIFRCMVELFTTRQALHTHTVMLIHILSIAGFPLLAAQCWQHFHNSRQGLLGACKYIQRQS